MVGRETEKVWLGELPYHATRLPEGITYHDTSHRVLVLVVCLALGRSESHFILLTSCSK